MEKVVLKTENIKKSFTQGSNTMSILDDICVSFNQGESYAITGVSGTGKSTFLHIIAGLDIPTSGHVMIDDRSLNRLSEQERVVFRNSMIGLVFQFPYLIKELSVLENVVMPLSIQQIPLEDARIEGLRALESVGLARYADYKPRALSGGEQQRIAIAQALVAQPAFLIADEPTGNLDEKTGADIVGLLVKCQKEWNMGLIISTHDMYVAQAMDHILVMHNGALEHKK